jgi:hypothetical protein
MKKKLKSIKQSADNIVWKKYNNLVDGCEITFVTSNLYYESDEYARQALYIYKKCPEGAFLSKNWREKGRKYP